VSLFRIGIAALSGGNLSPAEVLVGAFFADGHWVGDGGRNEQMADALGLFEGVFDFALGVGSEFEGFATTLLREVYDAVGFDAFFVLEVVEIVEIVEELHSGGFEGSPALFDFMHRAAFGKVEADEVVYENVFATGFGIRFLVQELSEGDVFLARAGGAAAAVFLFDAVGEPPEFAGTQNAVVHFGSGDAGVFKVEGGGRDGGRGFVGRSVGIRCCDFRCVIFYRHGDKIFHDSKQF
jgi:hypothetical protein